MLGTISSIFDPLGIAAPFILTGKRILQSIVGMKLDWNNHVPQEKEIAWLRWREPLFGLNKLSIPRCYKSNNCPIVSSSVHTYSDASNIGYGTVSYLRQVSSDGEVFVSFIIGKSRVAPLKEITVPRLELTAANLATNVTKSIVSELDLDQRKIHFIQIAQ